MHLHEEGKNDLSRCREGCRRRENFDPLQSGLLVLKGRRKKREEGEERLGQLIHYKAMEGVRRVKKSFRTLQVLR